MYRLLLAALGIGAVALAARKKSESEEPPGPGPLAGPDIGTIPAQPHLEAAKLKVYGTKTKPKLKNVPATVATNLPLYICNGGEGITVAPYMVTSQLDVSPKKVHASWGLYQWCMAYVSEGALGVLPAGVYVSVTSQSGNTLSFGPYATYEKAAEGIRVATAAAFDSAKGWAIG